MGTWLAIEAVAALLAALLWGEPAPATSGPECDRAAVKVECDGERIGGEH